MPLSFPSSPTVGQTSTQNGRTFTWSGFAWELSSNVAGHGSTHGASGADAVSLDASQIATGTLADARLSGNVITASTIAAATNNSTSSADAFSRVFTTSGQTPTSGNVHWTFFSPPYSFTASQISIANINNSTAITLARLGLYTADSSGAVTLVARTASDTSLFASTSTLSTRSFATAGGYPATYSLTAGARYALALCVVSTGTMPTIPAVLANSLFLWLTPRVTAYLTGQSDLPTSVASNGYTTTANNQVFWMRLS